MTNWLNPKNLAEATEVQREMAAHVWVEDDLPEVKHIGGADVSCNFRDPTKMIYAAVVALDSQLAVCEKSTVAERQEFPYIPGFLAFREAPAIVEALKSLKKAPDLLMVDGHGICHPRGLGIASHLGVLCDIPTIGVGKKILIGEPAKPLGEKAGSRVPLIWKGKEVAMLLRTRTRVQPLIVSAGHRISLATAVEWVLHCLKGTRLPEPTQQAHLASNELRRRRTSGLR